MSTEVDSALYVVVSLESRLFALKADDVESMVMLPAISRIPKAPEHVRGVALLREEAIPVIDLRARLGLPSLQDETDNLISMLTQRESEHRHWIEELELSITEGREFTLTTDHHACAFGKWYDSFETDNLILAALLKRFDAPHQRIHAIAHGVLELERANDLSEARRILDETRSGDLAEMMRLFGLLYVELREALREIAVVLEAGGQSLAVTVDSVEAVSRLVAGEGDDLKSMGIDSDGLITSVGRLERSDRLVLVLDTGSILDAQSWNVSDGD